MSNEYCDVNEIISGKIGDDVSRAPALSVDGSSLLRISIITEI